MLRAQAELNARWEAVGRPAFGLGIGLSTGPVAAALLGSEERLEYTLVGDTVNLAQRLQDLARPADRIVMSEATYLGLSTPPAACTSLGDQLVKGRETPVAAYLVDGASHTSSSPSVPSLPSLPTQP
jgi:class 3 adenylate cyclase